LYDKHVFFMVVLASNLKTKGTESQNRRSCSPGRELTCLPIFSSKCQQSGSGCVFLAFQNGAMICCGLDLDLSGLTAKKNVVDLEQMLTHPQFELPIA